VGWLGGYGVRRKAEGLELDGSSWTAVHESITAGDFNPTPWNPPRKLPEALFLPLLEAMVAKVRDPGELVAVIHRPPYACGSLDAATKLDFELGVRMERTGGVQRAPVGSTAVPKFVERYQSPACLHGHVHDGRGTARLGRSLCINPGSEYTDDVLCGAIVELGDHGARSYELVAGAG
jgi:uncharacterized protein